MDRCFAEVAERWPTIDFLVHAIGFSDKNELRGLYVDTSLENFTMTMNVSAYSFVAVTKRARAMMPDGGSILTLSYYGAEKVVPHYNVMGVAKAALEASVKYLAMDLGPEKIRVNAISAGPIKTLAASVLIGPAESAFTRIFSGPRSMARYLTLASSAALATPMTL